MDFARGGGRGGQAICRKTNKKVMPDCCEHYRWGNLNEKGGGGRCKWDGLEGRLERGDGE